MRWLLAILGLAAVSAAAVLGPLAFSAHEKPQPTGDLMYRYGSFVLRLTEEPCPFEELDLQLSDEGIPPARAYREQQRDGRWRTPGCWAADIGGDIMTRDTAGGEGTIPRDWLTR